MKWRRLKRCIIVGMIIVLMMHSISVCAMEVNEDTGQYKSISDVNGQEEDSAKENLEKEEQERQEEDIKENKGDSNAEHENEALLIEEEVAGEGDNNGENVNIEQYDLMSMYALNYAEEVMNDHLMEDAGIRIYDKFVSVVVTLQGNLKWTTGVEHDIANQNMIVSTNADGFFTGNDVITIDYKNVGVYKGKTIGIKVKLYPGTPSASEKEWMKLWGESATDLTSVAAQRNFSNVYLEQTNVQAYKDKANFCHGIRYSCCPRMQVSYEFYYSSNGSNIDADYVYFSWGSTNAQEGVSSNNAYTEYFKAPGAFPDVYTMYNGASYNSYTYNKDFTSGNYTTKYFWNTSYTFLMNNTSNDFTDTFGGETFWKSIGSMKVASSDNVYRFRMLTSSFWFTPMLAPIGATAPAPIKTITEGNSTTTEVDRKAGQEIEFNISQDCEYYGYTGTGYTKYSNFSFYDTLPTGVDYKSASVVRVYNGSTTMVTGNGTLSYNASTRKIAFSFNSSYLNSGMLYEGETYILKIKCILRSDAAVKITNQGTSVICNDTQTTNTVSVNHPLYQVTTEVVNGTITDSVYRIEKGGNTNITYAPNTGYYLKQIIVDGKSVSLTNYVSNYKFSNITANHTVKVVYEPYYSVSGRTWEDTDRNGQQAVSEAALNGITVQLLYKNTSGIYIEMKDSEGKRVNITTQNDAKNQTYTVPLTGNDGVKLNYKIKASASKNGGYCFSGLPNGVYGIRFEPGNTNLEKYESSPVNVGDDATDSDAVGNYKDGLLQNAQISGLDTVQMTTLTDGYFLSSHNDAGFYLKRGSITLKKIGDDGKPLQGAEFRLEQKINGKWTSVLVDNDMTDASGKLVYDDLEIGIYRLTETNTTVGNTLLKRAIEIILPYEKDAEGDTESAEATYTENGRNYYLNVTYTIQNGQVFDMPVSGGRGIIGFMAAGFCMMLIAGYFVFKQSGHGFCELFNKKEKRLKEKKK